MGLCSPQLSPSSHLLRGALLSLLLLGCCSCLRIPFPFRAPAVAFLRCGALAAAVAILWKFQLFSCCRQRYRFGCRAFLDLSFNYCYPPLFFCSLSNGVRASAHSIFCLFLYFPSPMGSLVSLVRFLHEGTRSFVFCFGGRVTY